MDNPDLQHFADGLMEREHYQNESTEAASPQGESDAMRCLPAGCGERPECERLPDRLTLSERMIEIRESLSRIEDFCIARSSRLAFTRYRDEILKHINDLTRAERQDAS